MLDKGIIERIVLDYKDIYKQAIEDNIQSPAELPYFEGDFWPNVMEDNIRELEEEEEARKKVQFFFISSGYRGTFREEGESTLSFYSFNGRGKNMSVGSPVLFCKCDFSCVLKVLSSKRIANLLWYR